MWISARIFGALVYPKKLNCLTSKVGKERGFRMNKKAVSWVLIGIVVVAVIVVGVVAYWLMTSGGEEGEENGEEVPDVAGATSLGFKVNATIGGTNELYAFTAKNLGTSEIMLRVDETDAEGTEFIYVYNQTAQTAWASIAGDWMDVSTEFDSYWSGENSAIVGYTAFDGYKTELATNWSGTGDHDYTSGEDTFHIYDIIVNPTVEDSLFQHG
jgi:hypothetical protein